MKSDLSRRKFLKNSVYATGMAAMAPTATTGLNEARLPREFWMAAVSQMDMRTSTPEEMLDEIGRIAENGMILKPDVLCLPETFAVANQNKTLTLSQMIDYSSKAVQYFSAFASKFGCHIICPAYTTENGKAYNSAVFINRNGSITGEYRKMHITIGEIESGLTPGPLDPPIFNTDIGIFGAQICYDIYWDDGWSKLAEKGAEIVFWPSAFAGGERVNMKALQHQYVVVSSTRKNTSKICDINGMTLNATGFWDKNIICTKINLEKVLVDTWPHFSLFGDIQKKYGRAVSITTLHEEQFSIIESVSPDIRVSDILKEFGIKSYRQEVKDAELAQISARNQ